MLLLSSSSTRPHLEVHVVVRRDEVALVLEPPLQADEAGLAGQVGEEGLERDERQPGDLLCAREAAGYTPWG